MPTASQASQNARFLIPPNHPLHSAQAPIAPIISAQVKLLPTINSLAGSNAIVAPRATPTFSVPTIASHNCATKSQSITAPIVGTRLGPCPSAASFTCNIGRLNCGNKGKSWLATQQNNSRLAPGGPYTGRTFVVEIIRFAAPDTRRAISTPTAAPATFVATSQRLGDLASSKYCRISIEAESPSANKIVRNALVARDWLRPIHRLPHKPMGT